MSRKEKILQPFQILLFSFLSLGLASGAAGTGWMCIVPIVTTFSQILFISFGGVLPSPSKRVLILWLVFVTSVFFVALRIRSMASVNLGFLPSQVVQIQGRVIYDSSITAKGNHMMKIMLRGCTTLAGDSASASGIVTVIGDRNQIISFATLVDLKGHFSDGLFIYDSINVMSRGWINRIREYLITRLQYRLAFDSDDASVLSTLLLLGRSDYAQSGIRSLAQNCGCSHILALSGMHLGIIATLSTRVFGKKAFGKAVSFILVFLFVFIAGPRPSLLRAALAFYLSSLQNDGRIFIVFLIQMILFPFSMVELGCCYGYVAVFAIVCLSPYIKASLFQFTGRLSGLFGASVSVLILSAPIQMFLTGRWYPVAIIAAPISGFLAACSMVIGMLLLAFGRIGFLVRLNSHVYSSLESVFTFFGTLPSAGWLGYLVLLVLIAMPFFALRIIRRILLKRCGSKVLEV